MFTKIDPHAFAFVGCLIAIAIGIADAHGWINPKGWGNDVDLMFILSGLGGLGVTITSAIRSGA